MLNIRAYIARATLCATLLLTAACAQAPIEEPPLFGARIGGPFTLTDQAGRTVRDTDFTGKYRLIYFGYSFCPDVCPVDLNYLMLGLKQFERQDAARAARIQPIFITIDPGRDTGPVLARFIAQFHPRLIGLTGTPGQIAAVADHYLVRYARQDGSRPDAYLMAHTQLAYLMAPDGKPVALIPVDDINTVDVNEGSPEKVAAELARWVQ